jgi:hypothetical protein
MSFEGLDDPSTSEEPGESVELSPKLGALGEQLSDDARMLASRYPAPSGRYLGNIGTFEAAIAEALRGECDRCDTEQSDPHVTPAMTVGAVGSRALWPWSVAIGVCAATVLIAAAIWQSVFPWSERYDRVLPAAAELAGRNEVTQSPEQEDDGGILEGATLRRAENVLRGLSAAEQEAVLDLLEEGSQRTASLSI